MPIKKDGQGNRSVEMAFIAPGSPEAVWHAMATGPGNSAWFTPTVIEERVGGRVSFSFGPQMSSKGEVTAWEPPHRFAYVENEWMPGAPPVATEITITSRSGDQCVVRMVHSLFATTDDWDDQMEGFEFGWPGFFEVLRIYLTHFAGRTGASFQAISLIEGDRHAAWRRLSEALGMAGANVGDRRSSAGGAEPLSGVIEHVRQDQRASLAVLRLDEPGIAFAGVYLGQGHIHVGLSVFSYGDDAAERIAKSEPKWREWLTATFPPAPGKGPFASCLEA